MNKLEEIGHGKLEVKVRCTYYEFCRQGGPSRMQ